LRAAAALARLDQALAAGLGMAVKNAVVLLDQLREAGIAVEVTHRAKRRLSSARRARGPPAPARARPGRAVRGGGRRGPLHAPGSGRGGGAADRAGRARDAGTPDPSLSRLAEWAGMAAWLVRLRACLLLPEHDPEAQAARDGADALRRDLARRAAVQETAGWLDARPHLGRDVFACGVAAAGAREAAEHAAGLAPPATGPNPALLFRSAAASTFVAILELTRQGRITLAQDGTFGTVTVQACCVRLSGLMPRPRSSPQPAVP
jgi:hypothetical protein